MDNRVIIHAGIKGMKWGVRRYQNSDGSLTPAGKKRYAKNQAQEEHEDYKKAHAKTNVKTMSNAELKAANNRLQMEQQYANLTKKKTSAGKKFVTGIMVGAATGVASAYASKYANKGAAVAEKLIAKGATKAVAEGKRKAAAVGAAYIIKKEAKRKFG